MKITSKIIVYKGAIYELSIIHYVNMKIEDILNYI